jgi:ATP-dependent helicase YprA (DUF1998 family)
MIFRVALYEFQPSGVSRKIFEFFDQLLDTCIKQIENCSCESGCPSCKSLTSTISLWAHWQSRRSFVTMLRA